MSQTTVFCAFASGGMLQITCTLNDGSGSISYNTSTNATSYLIESLAKDTVYLCTVRALLMSGGYGESSESVTVSTSQVTIKPTRAATRSSSADTAASTSSSTLGTLLTVD